LPSLLHKGENRCLIIVVGEVHGLFALGGRAHARDDRVQLAGSDARGKTVPLRFDDFDFVADGVGDLLRHHHVVAVGVLVAVADFDGSVCSRCLRPVVGRIVAFHADTQNFPLVSGTGAACGNPRQQHDGQKEHRDSLNSFPDKHKPDFPRFYLRFVPQSMRKL
jgi:hypothetical protein